MWNLIRLRRTFIPFFVLAIWSVGSNLSAQAQEIPAEVATKLVEARSMLGQQKFAEAELLLEDLARVHNLAGPKYLYAYALHAQKKYDQALEAYEAATAFANVKATARYNIACIYAVKGDKERALKVLSQAIDEGFSNFGQLASDPDFDSIKNDDRFKKLIPPRLEDDELFVEPTTIIHKLEGERPGDQFGWTARKVGDWDRDEVEDFVVTAPTHANSSGKVYVYSGKTAELLLESQGQPGEQFGNSAVGCGDINQDGQLDLIVGAPGSTKAGNAYVLSGRDGRTIHHWKGAKAGDRFGVEVSGVPDLNGDGIPELLVGADNGDGDLKGSGAVWVYSGKDGNEMFRLSGACQGASFGNSAAVCKNDDGSVTLAIGSQNAGPEKRGRVYAYRLEGSQPKLLFEVEGDANSVNLGQMFLSFPGDLNGDGFLDLYSSDFSDNSDARGGGKIRVVDGVSGKLLLEQTGKQPGEGLGTSPSDAGDVDGDGIGDLVVGAWQNAEGASSGGKIYLFSCATNELLATWTCRQAGDTLGFDACGIGDVDGDGTIDFLLTSAWSNSKGPKTGRVFVISGAKLNKNP